MEREIVTNSGLSLLDRSVVVLFFGLIVGQGRPAAVTRDIARAPLLSLRRNDVKGP